MAKIKSNELCPCDSGLLFKECHELKMKKPICPEITQSLELIAIPEPDPNTRATFIYDGDGTVCFSGYEVGLELVCQKCKSPLVQGVPPERIQNLVIRCNKCKTFNTLTP